MKVSKLRTINFAVLVEFLLYIELVVQSNFDIHLELREQFLLIFRSDR